jgi:hypothetical protein
MVNRSRPGSSVPGVPHRSGGDELPDDGQDLPDGDELPDGEESSDEAPARGAVVGTRREVIPPFVDAPPSPSA